MVRDEHCKARCGPRAEEHSEASKTGSAPQPRQCELLAAALNYRRRGWSIVPMAMARKQPVRKWKAHQSRRASEAQIRAWFANGADYGIGVIFGEVSGRLASRDFDEMEAYQRWADAHQDLARILPTVATRRGMHVYCIAAPGSIEAVRQLLGKPGTGAIQFADGELRAGIGCYSVLPPSVHPSGHVYRWVVLPGDELPIVDLLAGGFLGEVKGKRGAVRKSAKAQSNEAKNGILASLKEQDVSPKVFTLHMSSESPLSSPSSLSSQSSLYLSVPLCRSKCPTRRFGRGRDPADAAGSTRRTTPRTL
jgi:bifunctional DNA primase/polymerase-like protein